METFSILNLLGQSCSHRHYVSTLMICPALLVKVSSCCWLGWGSMNIGDPLVKAINWYLFQGKDLVQSGFKLVLTKAWGNYTNVPKHNIPFCKKTCISVRPDGSFNFGHLHQSKIAQQHNKYAKEGAEFYQIQNNSSFLPKKLFGQSGKVLPNLVTLRLRFIQRSPSPCSN